MTSPAAATRLDEIRERVEAATPGPWFVDGPEFGGLWVTAYRDGESIAGGQPVHPSHKDQSFAVMAGLGDEDAAFIAAAREDVPFLLAEIARLQALLDERDQVE